MSLNHVLESIEPTPTTPKCWFAVRNRQARTIAFCGPPKAPGEAGQGYVIMESDLPAMHLELLATLDDKIEAANLDQQNIGTTAAARRLLEIAKDGVYRGVFACPVMDECARLIVDLYKRANANQQESKS